MKPFIKAFTKKGLLLTLLLSIISFGAIITIGANAADVRDGVTHIDQKELAEKIKGTNSVLIDIRTQGEVDDGFIPGAKHIPITELMKNSSLLDEYKGKDLIFYCHTGVRAKRLTDFLQDKNHSSKDQLYHLKGDWRAWQASGNEVITK